MLKKNGGSAGDAADGMEAVGVGRAVENALAVEGVDAHLSGGVDDAAVAEADAYVDDAPLGVLEEGEVVAQGVARADLDAAGGLLRRVARKPEVQRLETDLREARAVDAGGGASAPEVGGAEEEALREVGRGAERHILLVVHPALVTVIVQAYCAPFLLAAQHLEGVARQQLIDHLRTVGRLAPHRDSRQETVAFHHLHCQGGLKEVNDITPPGAFYCAPGAFFAIVDSTSTLERARFPATALRPLPVAAPGRPRGGAEEKNFAMFEKVCTFAASKQKNRPKHVAY